MVVDGKQGLVIVADRENVSKYLFLQITVGPTLLGIARVPLGLVSALN